MQVSYLEFIDANAWLQFCLIVQWKSAVITWHYFYTIHNVQNHSCLVKMVNNSRNETIVLKI